MFKKSFLLFCLVVLGVSANVSWSGNDDEAYIIGLRYPKSYDAKTYKIWPDRFPDITNISYKVRLFFPSEEVVHFYDDKLKAIGWFHFIQPNYPEADRTWQKFIDGTVKGNPLVHQLLTAWVNKNKTRMVMLGIRYHSFYLNKKENIYARELLPNNIIQEVILQVSPFYILERPTPGKSD